MNLVQLSVCSLFVFNSEHVILLELLISSSNLDLIEVEKVETINSTLKVLAILKNANFFSDDVSNLHLLLRSELTNQTERIPVQIRLFGTLEELSSQFYPYLLRSLYTLFTTVIALGFAFAFFWYKKSAQKALPKSSSLFDTPDSSRRGKIIIYFSSIFQF